MSFPRQLFRLEGLSVDRCQMDRNRKKTKGDLGTNSSGGPGNLRECFTTGFTCSSKKPFSTPLFPHLLCDGLELGIVSPLHRT
jgi:hypothetical protein